MAELKLFKINGTVEELKSKSVTIEKELQRIIEKNMQDFLRYAFLHRNIGLIMGEWIRSG